MYKPKARNQQTFLLSTFPSILDTDQTEFDGVSFLINIKLGRQLCMSFHFLFILYCGKIFFLSLYSRTLWYNTPCDSLKFSLQSPSNLDLQEKWTFYCGVQGPSQVLKEEFRRQLCYAAMGYFSGFIILHLTICVL